MVSPLSSRILNAEAKANINGSPFPYRPLTKNVMESWQRQKKRVSGYSADCDMKNPPASTLCSLDKQVRAHQVEISAKRRRIEELNFQASNVREDLARAGIHCLPGLIGRSHALPHNSVDMDKVRLVTNSSKSPFIEKEDDQQQPPQKQQLPPQQQQLQRPVEYPVSDCFNLLNSCQHFYTTTNGRIPTPSEDAVNEPNSNNDESNSLNTTTDEAPSSSSSDNDSLEGNAIGIPVNMNMLGQDFSNDVSSSSRCCSPLPFMNWSMDTCVLRLDEAIATFDSARMIVENSSGLFKVVHANAAMTRLTTISSDTLFGQPLAEIFNGSFKSVKENNKTIITIPTPNAKTKDQPSTHAPYVLSTFPIKGRGVVTHYALDLNQPSLYYSKDELDALTSVSVCDAFQKKAFTMIG